MIETVARPYRESVGAFNKERMCLFLELQEQHGQIWDSFEKRFLPGARVYHMLQYEIRGGGEVAREKRLLLQTPSRGDCISSSYLHPGSFRLPVILDGELEGYTMPDFSFEEVYGGVFASNLPSEIYSKLEIIVVCGTPKDIPEDLALQYRLPPAIKDDPFSVRQIVRDVELGLYSDVIEDDESDITSCET
jgi:hypothetical protein